MKKLSFLMVLGCAMAFKAVAQTPDYKERISIINKNIYQTFYDKGANLYLETNNAEENKGNHSFLWPLTALLQAANEMEVLEPGKQYIAPVMKAINQYYSGRAPAPGYQAMVVKEKQDARFYDDNEWIAIALMDAYARTHKKEYLETSKMIYRFLLTGHNQVGGGGFYWEEGNLKSKNTCSNGPGVLVALRLYQATKQKAYLDTAISVYNWTKKNLLSPKGVYYDNLQLPSLKIDSAFYTYNAGTMLQSGVILYNITKDTKYLDDAMDVAKGAEKVFFKNGKLPNNYWFNAVLIRGYLELYKVEKNKSRLNFILTDAEHVWNNEHDSQNLLGNRKIKSLIDQSAMLETYSRLAALK
ncbi:glycoside hydrolase family 76 protein [Mucilaginibacter pedocola]|uniref:Glycoside hydrolase n=1 Tax=Mucilaginibacter pedocola TaxID=1792845 RepID=A0A1S9P7N7_9SPHI|nr:glycoside hydrolase family 76 protein [Mucilaginibacter pedocola]OOQ56668.1 glycoside hydrolase [Mucilaginibacter pedocola]